MAAILSLYLSHQQRNGVNEMTTARKTIAKKANAKGVQFALVTDGATFELWVLRENYSRECKGGMKKTWRYVERGMCESKARAMFDSRTK